MNTSQEMFPYSKVMAAISELQGERAAIVILQNENGSTTYLRHKISEEDATAILKQTYDH